MRTRKRTRRSAAAAAATAIRSQSVADDEAIPPPPQPASMQKHIKIITMQIGEHLERWNSLKKKLKMETHEHMAGFLLDVYDQCQCTSSQTAYDEIHEVKPLKSSLPLPKRCKMSKKAPHELEIGVQVKKEPGTNSASIELMDTSIVTTQAQNELPVQIIGDDLENDSLMASNLSDMDTVQYGDNKVSETPTLTTTPEKGRESSGYTEGGKTGDDIAGKGEGDGSSEEDVGDDAYGEDYARDDDDDDGDDDESVRHNGGDDVNDEDYVGDDANDSDSAAEDRRMDEDEDIEKEHIKPEQPSEFKCWECQSVFPKRRPYIAHLRECVEKIKKEDYSCDHCQHSFPTLPTLLRHKEAIARRQKETTDGPDLECWQCKAVHFRDRMLWWQHLRKCLQPVEGTSNVFPCPKCNRKYTGIKHTVIHVEKKCGKMLEYKKQVEDDKVGVQSKLGREMYKCKTCDRVFTYVKNFLRHKETCCKTYTCQKCEKSFRTLDGFNAHTARNNCEPLEPPKMAHLCLKIFYKRDSEGSMRMYTDSSLQTLFSTEPTKLHQLKFRCEVCFRYYDDSKSFKKHIAKCTVGKYQYACKLCNKLFKAQEGCLTHIEREVCQRQDVKDEPKIPKSKQCTSVCEVCGKVYKCVYSLKTHMQVHTGETKFACKFCDKKFFDGYSHRKHEKRHTDVPTQYVCQYCGRNFIKRDALCEHEVSHTGKGSFTCRFCPKMFAFNINCVIHERKHTGEKPHKCRYCEKHFAKHSNRKVHERLIHTKEFPHWCPHCQKGFVARNAMNAHAKNCKANVFPSEVNSNDNVQAVASLSQMELMGTNMFESL